MQKRGKEMKWNVEDIAFLYPPDVFAGSFDNAKMQARHDQQVQTKLEEIKAALDREADPLAAMRKLHAKDHFKFFQNNEGLFRDAGRFEETVLVLYGKINNPFTSDGDPAVWESLFAACDQKRLFGLGSPVTFASATVYRGSVVGSRRGLSWTPSRQRAEWFAKRWQDPALGGGELYEVDIVRANILVYLKDRHDEEIIVAPDFIKSAEIRAFQPRG
jgi:hypothetical protein